MTRGRGNTPEVAGKRRVLLLCAPSLLGESLENILSRGEGIELIGPWALDDPVLAQLPTSVPDVVLVAEVAFSRLLLEEKSKLLGLLNMQVGKLGFLIFLVIILKLN